MTRRELILRGKIMASFAVTGVPPAVIDDVEALHELERRHVVVLRDGRVHMAHPFAAHHDRARVDSGDETWWGNCGWDGLGIVAALGLREARVTCDGVTVHVVAGTVVDDALFAVRVPASRWWDDIDFT